MQVLKVVDETKPGWLSLALGFWAPASLRISPITSIRLQPSVGGGSAMLAIRYPLLVDRFEGDSLTVEAA